MVLPDDFRNGIYTDGSVIATVDVRCSKNEILMHDEITDKTFILTPHELSKWEKIGTKDMLYDEKTNMAFPVKMSLDEFYAKNGCPFFVSGDSLDKCRFPYGRTERQKKRDAKRSEIIGAEYAKKRQETRELYNKYVSEGKIIPKTKEELMIERANGHPDNPSVQAARRMCEKRGIVWSVHTV